MSSESVPKTESTRLRLWLRGETRFAAFGLIVVALFVVSMWGAAWWSVRTQQETTRQAQTEQARLKGNALARCAEIMLADGGEPRLAVQPHAQPCRFRLRDGFWVHGLSSEHVGECILSIGTFQP